MVNEVFGEVNVDIVVARELTKGHEEIIRGIISHALAHFTESPPKDALVGLLLLENKTKSLKNWSCGH